MIALLVNGTPREVDAPADKPLLWVLREDLGIVGPKFGCGVAACGACTVHVDGEALRSCSLSAALHDEITLKNGAVEQSSFFDYDAVRLADAPEIAVHLVDGGCEVVGGVGEPGTPPIAPAVANAILAATGQRLRSLSLRIA